MEYKLKLCVKTLHHAADIYNVKEIYMSHQYSTPYTALPTCDILIPNTANPKQAVEYINSYIDKTKCEEFSVDISFMNIIDACYVSTMCSTKHYIKYPEGKINWLVSSNYVQEFSNNMLLGNSKYYLQ